MVNLPSPSQASAVFRGDEKLSRLLWAEAILPVDVTVRTTTSISESDAVDIDLLDPDAVSRGDGVRAAVDFSG
jgi:hypothetical protein